MLVSQEKDEIRFYYQIYFQLLWSFQRRDGGKKEMRYYYYWEGKTKNHPTFKERIYCPPNPIHLT